MSKSQRPRRGAPAEPDLMGEVRTAVADPDPLHLLSYASMLLTAVDPRRKEHPLAAPDGPSREGLAAIFIDVPAPDITALLAVIARASGYLPDAVDAADGDWSNGVDASRGEAADYNFQQRAADLALVNGGGPMTPERAAAAARLRDYDTIQNPASTPAAARLAGERLDDFQTSRFPPGSLPPDHVLGADPRRRALVRQEWQRQLEQGTPTMPPMTPDEATTWMDQQEAQARVVAMDAMVKGLENQGLSRGAATDVAQAMAQGATLRDIAATAGPLSEIKQLDGALSDGKHSLPWERYSTADLKAISGLGKALFVVGSVAEAAYAYSDYANGAAPGKVVGGLLGSLGGGFGGGLAGGMAGGAVLGPGGAFVGAVTGGLIGGEGLKSIGSTVGSSFDR